MHRFAVCAWKLFPSRVADSFAELCWQYVVSASERCGSSVRLTRRADPDYDREEKRFQEWLARVIEMKARLGCALFGTRSLIHRLDSLEPLAELVRLDEIPVDSNPDWRDSVARSYFAPEEFGALHTRMRFVCERLITDAVAAATSLGDAGQLSEERKALYTRIARVWFSHPLFESNRALFDDPGKLEGFYPAIVMEAFEEGVPKAVLAGAVKALEQIVEQVPLSSGPARHLALILFRTSEFERAVAVLEKTCERAVSDDGRREAKKLLSRARVNRAVELAEKDPVTSFDALASETASGEFEDERLPNTLVSVAVMMGMKTRKWDRHDRLRSVLKSWHANRPATKPDGEPEKRDGHPSKSKVNLDTLPWRRPVGQGEVKGTRVSGLALLEIPRVEPVLTPLIHERLVSCREPFDADVDPEVVKYLLAAAGAMGENAKVDWDAMYKAMDEFLSGHECMTAVYWRMMAAWGLASADPANIKNYLPIARKDATEVKTLSKDPHEVENSEKILDAIREI